MGAFKKINGFDYDYCINDSGDVIKVYEYRYRLDNPIVKVKPMKGGMYSNGYRFVALTKNGESHNYLIHRLVAGAFVPNPNNYPCVNHKDGNKLNNDASNLEWCTQAQNLRHAVSIGLVESQCKIRRKVVVSAPDGSVMHFDSMHDCCKYFGYKKGLAWTLHKSKRKPMYL